LDIIKAKRGLTELEEKYIFRPSWLTLIPHVLLMVVFVGFITFPIQILTILTTKITVTKDRVYGQTGILHRTTQNSPISKVQSVIVDRTLFGRILGYGKVRISTADGIPVVYSWMGRPKKIQEIINKYI
jgi:uncharacterized membrane protein YdbT with pleckstrin-like domain